MRRKIPSTQALACFESAARHLSYTRAAQELALTQSAVSRQITALESFLGVALFARTRHGVTLTPSGVEYARQVAQRLSALERDTLDAMTHQGSGGSISLAAVPTFATRWLVPRLADLACAHPELTINIETRTRPFLFADQEFDAALYAGTAEQVHRWAGTMSTPLISEEVVPVCSPRLMKGRPKLTPAQIAQMPLLQQSTRPDAWRQWFDEQGVQASSAAAGPRYELFSMVAVAAAHGLGVALVPTMLIEQELARNELVICANTSMASHRSYYLVAPSVSAGRPERPAVTVFRQWLLTQVPAKDGVA